MGLLYSTYSAVGAGIFFSCLAPFWAYTRIRGRDWKGLRERAGLISPHLLPYPSGSPRIWLHAASLGEVRAAGALGVHLSRLIPGCSLIVSTSTEHGRNLAMKTFQNTPVIYAPLDTPFPVRRVLGRLRPDVMVFLETEIWPVWITEAKKRGIRIALVNGRISGRSFKRYLAVKPLFRDVMRSVDAFSMIREEDGERIRRMGADPSRVRINGNAKYELLASEPDPSLEAEMRSLLNLAPSQVVLVAGSTRPGEEEMILTAYQRILGRFPEAVLIIAPRHINRTPVIETLLRAGSVRYQLWTDLAAGGRTRVEQVVLVNTFGDLFGCYSVGTINFCGGSLVPLGGQNPLEPAAWSKPVFYGPSMEDFLDAKGLLESAGAGTAVDGPEDLAEKAIALLNDPGRLKRQGEAARRALQATPGAGERHARVIAELARDRGRKNEGRKEMNIEH
jgi:3-deoxy-D-manno-octulosonic-acid transferase